MLCEGKGSKTLPYTHILDLAEDGFIKPHVDSARVGGGLLKIFSKLAVLQIQSIFTSVPDLEVYCTDPDSPFPVQNEKFFYKFLTESPKTIQKIFNSAFDMVSVPLGKLRRVFSGTFFTFFHLAFRKYRLGSI
jgi:hypothetical protein